MRAVRALVATALVALVCVAAAVSATQKIKLRVDGVSHTYAADTGYLCVRISGTAGSRLLVEIYGPGVTDGHMFTQSLLNPKGRAFVGVTLTAPGKHRVKVTANKPKQGRAVVTKDYTVPTQDIAPLGRFACI